MIKLLNIPLNICKHPDCNNLVSDVSNRTKVWLNYCSKSCLRKHNVLKAKQTCLIKYGVDNPAKNIDVINKMKSTISDRTEDESKAIRLKHEESCIKNHGVKYTFHSADIKEKRKNTFIEKYGVEHYSKTDEFRSFISNSQQEYSTEKKHTIQTSRETTCMKIYGVDNPAKDPGVHSKKMSTAYTSKQYKLPSGKAIIIQGWENKALDELLKEYSEDDICYDSLTIPCIKYIGTDNKEHTYYPDFYIPGDNLIIEVKSTYTYSGNQIWIDVNSIKEKACKDAGYNFKFMIY
jgi:hypothetical protein